MKLNLQGKIFKVKMMYHSERPSGNLWDMVVEIYFDDVLYVENYNRNTLIHTNKGEYLVTKTFSEVKRLLETDARFKYSHCSYLVNVEKVYEITENGIIINSDYKKHIIPLTKRRRKDFF